jgi:hypothetical protein
VGMGVASYPHGLMGKWQTFFKIDFFFFRKNNGIYNMNIGGKIKKMHRFRRGVNCNFPMNKEKKICINL